MTASALSTELLRLEEQLLQPAFRRDRAAVSALLAEDFVEFGSSGRIFSKAQILDVLAEETGRRIELTEFAVHLLAPDAALATYRAVLHTGSGAPGATLRSSLWIRGEGRWQMRFHQGTRIPAANQS